MENTISQALVGTSDQLESEASLTLAIDAIPKMADIADSRIVLKSCIEQVLMSDGSTVDVLSAEQEYKEWRAEHLDLVEGRAFTGTALLEEMKSSLEMLNSPSMESDTIQAFKRTFNKMALMVKTFGKNLNVIRNRVNNSRGAIEANPVLLQSPSIYGFLTRANQPVKLNATSLDKDVAFLNKCEEIYSHLFDKTSELGKAFTSACRSEDRSAIGEAIDYLESNQPDRDEMQELTKFHLLGNRMVQLNKNGFPTFAKNGNPWAKQLKSSDSGIVGAVARKKLHGFSVGGVPTKVPTIDGINPVAAKRQISTALSSTGGAVSTSDFVKLIDKANALNVKASKFAMMASTMTARLDRLERDMDAAWDSVNNEQEMDQNVDRIHELRALHKAASRSVATYMFMAKSLATVMEDHTSYVYRNVAIIANEVLKNTGTKDEK